MFAAIRIAEFTFGALCIALMLLVIFQVVVPILAGTPLFPILRHKPKEAARKLAEAIEEKGVRDVEEAASTLLRKPTVQKGR